MRKLFLFSALLTLFFRAAFAQSDLQRPATSFQQWLDDPHPIVSAHRGGPYSGYPENALESFAHIANQMPAIIECDVAMTRDSILVLMHDQDVDRTTNGAGKVSDLTYDELKDLKLRDPEGVVTDFGIPTLAEVLEWGRAKVLFTLDIKRGVPFERVLEGIEAHQAVDYAAVITYSLRDAQRVHALNPQVVLSISLRDEASLEVFKQSGITHDRVLAFVGTREPEAAHYAMLAELGIPSILGTLGNLDRSAMAKANDSVYLDYIQRGALILATDRPLEVWKVIGSLGH